MSLSALTEEKSHSDARYEAPVPVAIASPDRPTTTIPIAMMMEAAVNKPIANTARKASTFVPLAERPQGATVHSGPDWAVGHHSGVTKGARKRLPEIAVDEPFSDAQLN
jgi:hypothetical protein